MTKHSYIKELIHQFLAADNNTIAFSIFDGIQIKNISYPQFAKDILKTAGFLQKNKIQNHHIALLAPASYEWIVMFFSVIATGNVAVCLNPDLPIELLYEQCTYADVSVIWSNKVMCNKLQDSMTNIKFLNQDDFEDTVHLEIDDITQCTPTDTVLLMATSGTTGRSKLVAISDCILRDSLNNLDDMMTTTSRERIFSAVPLFHIAGLKVMLEGLSRYKILCIGRGTKYMLMDMPHLNPTDAFFVPVMLESISKLLKRTPSAEERCKLVGTRLTNIVFGGASLRPSVCHALMDLGYNVEVMYAMTELTGDGTWCLLDKEHITAIGKPVGKMQCRIHNGEILVAGPSLMKEYYKDPEETNKIIENGWLHTGDIGYCDEDGYFYITGRKKNVIVLANGENVNPEEIEAKFSECEAIVESMVYSNGKGICADIYTQNQEAAALFVQDYNNNMPMYRQVYKVNYSPIPLEKTYSGKIKRKENTYEQK